MKKRNAVFFYLMIFSVSALTILPIKNLVAQNNLYWVYLEEKATDLTTWENPFDYFSPRGVLRKAQQQVLFDKQDLPIRQEILQEIETLARVKMQSKWLNAVLVETEHPDLLEHLDFVDRIEARIPMRKYFASLADDDANFQYGSARLQTEQVFGDLLHARGMTGSNVLIAVFDGGFHNTPNLSVFDDLFNEGRLKGTYSFVLQDSNVFTRGSHGTHVLSVMAAKTRGIFVGTAPDADYWLFMTEDQLVEVNAEEHNWLAAAEVSDSLGVDIINSSLGYTTFDPGQNDYTPADLDGQTGIVTQAALFAARKGMLVVNSAGNAGASNWRKIVKPADADSIIAVGAVDIQGNRANFSSEGPTIDGRIKPEVMARGAGTYYIATNGLPATGNGTSLSSPIIAGLAACLRQAYPHHSTENLRQTIIRSAHLYFNPDTLMGFGIPNFDVAFNNVFSVDEFASKQQINIYPNPAENRIQVSWSVDFDPIGMRVFSTSGRLVRELTIRNQQTSKELDISDLSSGTYVLHIYGQSKAISSIIIKQ